MNNIYIITQGEYSDYHIVCVFDSKELAEAYVAKFTSKTYGSYDIEEYILNGREGSVTNQLSGFRVSMFKNGDIKHIEENIDMDEGDQACYSHGEHHWGEKIPFMVCSTLAKDKNHAIKITNEKRVQLIAQDMWAKPEPKPNKKTHLRYDMYGASLNNVEKHPQVDVCDLGITYKYSIPQSLGDQWWFWDCKYIPETLPDYIKEMEVDEETWDHWTKNR